MNRSATVEGLRPQLAKLDSKLLIHQLRIRALNRVTLQPLSSLREEDSVPVIILRQQ